MRRLLLHPKLTLAARMILGLVFIAAALPKIADPPGFAKAIWAYALFPPWSLNPLALLLPWLELFCGLALCLGRWVRAAALWSSALLLSFSLALTVNLARHHPIDCGCFGSAPHGSEAERLGGYALGPTAGYRPAAPGGTGVLGILPEAGPTNRIGTCGNQPLGSLRSARPAAPLPNPAIDPRSSQLPMFRESCSLVGSGRKWMGMPGMSWVMAHIMNRAASPQGDHLEVVLGPVPAGLGQCLKAVEVPRMDHMIEIQGSPPGAKSRIGHGETMGARRRRVPEPTPAQGEIRILLVEQARAAKGLPDQVAPGRIVLPEGCGRRSDASVAKPPTRRTRIGPFSGKSVGRFRGRKVRRSPPRRNAGLGFPPIHGRGINMGDPKPRALLGGLHRQAAQLQPPGDLLEGEFGRVQRRGLARGG